jgi:polar amino acid transport system substrate-binding protein
MRSAAPLEWRFVPWSEMLPSVRSGDADGALCGQGITAQRLELVDFTRPYAVFNESVLVRAGSTNMRLTETFETADPVPFSGTSDDVFGEMLEALRSGAVDAVVDDDVALIPVADDPELAIAFTAETRIRWGMAVSNAEPQLRGELDGALERLHADGELAAIWSRWMPSLPYPF